jgi:hypothetical protein
LVADNIWPPEFSSAKIEGALGVSIKLPGVFREPFGKRKIDLAA